MHRGEILARCRHVELTLGDGRDWCGRDCCLDDLRGFYFLHGWLRFLSDFLIVADLFFVLVDTRSDIGDDRAGERRDGDH